MFGFLKMLAWNGMQGGYSFCPVRNLRLNEAIGRVVVTHDAPKLIFFEGDPLSPQLLLEAKKYLSPDVKFVKLEFEEPNRFFLMNSVSDLHLHREYMRHVFDAVFSICPYTTMAENSSILPRYHTFFPYPTEDILTQRNQKLRTHNVIYTGHIFNRNLFELVKIVHEFDGIVVSGSQTGLETHRQVSYGQKLDLYRSSRLSIIHNVLYPSKSHASSIVNLSEDHCVRSNQAFYELLNSCQNRFPELPFVPQIKSRIFEAAFNKSMMLVSADSHKLASNYFTENHEFVYFNGNEDLREKIAYYLKNQDERNAIAVNAYSRAICSYTTDHFIRHVLSSIG